MSAKRYRKKPVVIEAEQYLPDSGEIPMDVVELPRHVAKRLTHTDGLAWIETLEGGHVVSPGDFIITGIQGEKYPCKCWFFEQTYEEV